MAQVAIGVAGGVLGFALGGPLGAAVGFMGGLMLGNAILPSSKPVSQQQNILMGSAWGAFRPILYGTSRIGGMMIWSGPIKSEPGKSAGGSGKGLLGGGSSGSSEEVQYSASFAVAFCEGPATAVTRIWANGQLIYDQRNPSDADDDNNLTFFFHSGNEAETPDSYIAFWVSENVPNAPNAVPAFRGTCYVVFHDLNLNPYGGAIPQISAEVTNANTSNLPILPFQLSAIEGSPFTGASGPFCVDWVRGILYATDNGVGYRMLSLQTMEEVGQIVGTSTPSAIGCGQGTMFYAYEGATLYQYSPDTLKSIGSFGPNTSGGDTSNQVTGLALVNSIAVVTVTGPIGTQDFIVCGTFGTSGGYGIVSGAGMGFVQASGVNAVNDLAATGPDAFTLVVAGAQNTGFSEAWMLNYGIGIDASPALYIYLVSIQLNASFGLLGGVEVTTGIAVTQMGALTQDDFVPGSGTGGVVPTGFCYDATDDTLVIQGNGATIKWSWANGVVWQQSSDQGGTLHPQSRPNGTLGFPNGVDPFDTFTYMDATDGTVISTKASTTNPGSLSSASPDLWDGVSKSTIYLGVGGNVPVRAYLGLGSTGPWTLADILTDICERGGLTSDQIDVSQVTGINVTGYLLNEMITCADAIRQLQAAYFFDVVESDFTLKFVPRGQTPVLTIDQASLASVTGPDSGNYWQQTRSQEQDLPLYVQLNFTDSNNDYMPSAAYSQRISSPVPITLSKQRVVTGLPLSMTISQALVVTQTTLWTTWAERNTYATTLGWEFAYLDPTDVVTVNLDDGESFTARITSIQMGADYTLKVELQGVDVQTYTQSTNVVPTTPAYVQEVSPQGNAQPRFFPFNLPLLRDQDYTAGGGAVFYFGAGSFNGLFFGATLNQSSNGTNYSYFNYVPTQVTWGNCLTTLPAPPSYFATDYVSTLTVLMVNQTADLASCTYLEMVDGANAALVGNEIIQFMNVTANDDNSYTLNGLLRGRKGTEWACGTHVAAEQLIILDTNINVSPLPLTDNNTTDYYKLQGVGQALDGVTPVSFKFLGYDQKPYAPVCFSDELTGGNLVVSWVRRTRASGNLMDGTGTVPLFEETESYDAYIVASPYNQVAANYATPGSFVRSFMGLSSPTFTYTSAMMTTDGFNPATQTLYVVVFQNSVTIGHGWPGSASLPPV